MYVWWSWSGLLLDRSTTTPFPIVNQKISRFRKKHTLYKKPPHKCFNTQLKRTHTKNVCIVECVYWFYFLLQKHPCAVQFLVWSQHTWTIHNLVCGKNWTCCVAFNFLLHQHSWAVHLLVWSQHTWTIHKLV